MKTSGASHQDRPLHGRECSENGSMTAVGGGATGGPEHRVN